MKLNINLNYPRDNSSVKLDQVIIKVSDYYRKAKQQITLTYPNKDLGLVLTCVLSVVNVDEAHLLGIDMEKIYNAENPSRVDKVKKR